MAVSVASAPGKVLIVGGYLVLERPHFGLALAASARFHAAVQSLPPNELKGQGSGETSAAAGEASQQSLVWVQVRSPQMSSSYIFQVELPSLTIRVPRHRPGQCTHNPTQEPSRNPFVERAVQLALAVALFHRHCHSAPSLGQNEQPPLGVPEAARDLAAQGVDILLLGDNDFYSHRQTLHDRGLPLSVASLNSLPPFSPIVSAGPPTTAQIAESSTQKSKLETTEGTRQQEEGTEIRAEVAEKRAEGIEKREEGIEKSAEGVEKGAEGVEEGAEGVEKGAEGIQGIVEGMEKRAEGTEKRSEGKGNGESSAQRSVAAKMEKTGLGSSAAMTAAVCAALLKHWGLVGPTLQERGERGLVHRVAQAAHCWGQGKVGSGFDIAAAVFGSVHYVRFSSHFLDPLMAQAAHELKGQHESGVQAEWMRLAIALCGPQPSGKGEVAAEKGEDSSKKEVLSERGGDISEKGEDVFKKEEDVPEKGEDVSERGKHVSPASSLASSLSPPLSSSLGRPRQLWLRDEFWDFEADLFALPPGLLLMVGETGGGGSSTPSMLSAIRRWQSKSPTESASAWQQLSAANTALAHSLRLLQRLSASHPSAYSSALDQCSTLSSEQWITVKNPEYKDKEGEDGAAFQQTVGALIQTRATFLDVRAGLQLIGSSAAVPIEPAQQTELLDKTMAAEGILFSGVPGAGGYDAIFAVVLRRTSAERVAALWSNLNVMPIGFSSKEIDQEGLRFDDDSDVKPWIALQSSVSTKFSEMP